VIDLILIARVFNSLYLRDIVDFGGRQYRYSIYPYSQYCAVARIGPRLDVATKRVSEDKVLWIVEFKGWRQQDGLMLMRHPLRHLQLILFSGDQAQYEEDAILLKLFLD
jgi:hypothetical protein